MPQPTAKQEQMPKNSCSPDSVKVKIFVTAFVAESLHKITSRELASTLSAKFDLSGKQARDLIHAMVCEGELVYVYEHGCSIVTTSLYRPVRLSPRMVLLPPDVRYRPAVHEVIFRIQSGAAFGSGGHPTTRLALRGIEYALLHDHTNRNRPEGAVVDIGTGSGRTAGKFYPPKSNHSGNSQSSNPDAHKIARPHGQPGK